MHLAHQPQCDGGDAWDGGEDLEEPDQAELFRANEWLEPDGDRAWPTHPERRPAWAERDEGLGRKEIRRGLARDHEDRGHGSGALVVLGLLAFGPGFLLGVGLFLLGFGVSLLLRSCFCGFLLVRGLLLVCSRGRGFLGLLLSVSLFLVRGFLPASSWRRPSSSWVWRQPSWASSWRRPSSCLQPRPRLSWASS